MPREHLFRLGQMVRRARTTAGLTQAQLGDPLLSKSFISQLEQGTVSPSLASLFHIGDKVGVRPAQLLGIADETQWAVTSLDMAEAALVLDGIGAGNAWVQRLESVIPIAKLSDCGQDHRWQRYVGIQRLLQGQTTAAIALFEAAMKDVPAGCDDADGGSVQPDADDQLTTFWLGAAHKQASHLLQALRVWEKLVTFDIPPLLAAATWVHLSELYGVIGDEYESRRATEYLEGATHEQACLHVGEQLARLLWQCADKACTEGDLGAASAHARLIPVLLFGHTLQSVSVPADRHDRARA